MNHLQPDGSFVFADQFPNTPVWLHCVKQTKFLKHVMAWSINDIKDDWPGYCRHPDILAKHGINDINVLARSRCVCAASILKTTSM